MKLKGSHDQTLPRGHHRVTCINAHPVLISLDDDPARACPAGTNSFVLRTLGDTKLSVDPSEAKSPYSLNIRTRKHPPGERVDDLPPPQPAPPENYLQAMREKVRQSLGVNREAFEDQAITIYEAGEVDKFEEELIEDAKSERDARIKKAKEKREADQKAIDEAKPTEGAPKEGPPEDSKEKGKETPSKP